MPDGPSGIDAGSIGEVSNGNEFSCNAPSGRNSRPLRLKLGHFPSTFKNRKLSALGSVTTQSSTPIQTTCHPFSSLVLGSLEYLKKRSIAFRLCCSRFAAVTEESKLLSAPPAALPVFSSGISSWPINKTLIRSEEHTSELQSR